MVSEMARPEKESWVVEELRSERGLAWRRLLLGKARLREARRTSFILAAFSLSTMTELQTDDPDKSKVPGWLWVVFAMHTVLLITVHVFSLVISTCLLPSMEAATEEYRPPEPHRPLRGVPACSPHDRLRGLVEISVTLSSVLGLVLFMVEVALLAVLKFWSHAPAAGMAGSLVMVPALVCFLLFCWYFRHTLDQHAYSTRHEQIAAMQAQLEAGAGRPGMDYYSAQLETSAGRVRQQNYHSDQYREGVDNPAFLIAI